MSTGTRRAMYTARNIGRIRVVVHAQEFCVTALRVLEQIKHRMAWKTVPSELPIHCRVYGKAKSTRAYRYLRYITPAHLNRPKRRSST